MPGNINNIIGAAHHKNRARIIDKPGIGGFVKSWKFFQIGCQKALIVVPERRKCARRKGQFGDQSPDLTGCDRLAILIDDLSITPC